MRRAAVLALVAAAAAVRPRPAGAQALTRVRLSSSPNDDLIASLWAMESGAFRTAGLDVDLQKANSGSAVAAAVVGGAIDIGKSSVLSIVQARTRGIPFVMVAPCGIYRADNPTIGLIVGKSSAIHLAKDLNGKIAGVSALNDLFALGIQAWVDKNGGNASSLRFVEVPSTAIAEAVASGRIDAASLAEPHLGEALRSADVRQLAAPNSAIAGRFMQAVYFTTADYVAKNRATVDAFRGVIERAGAYANEHHDRMIPIIAAFTHIPATVIASLPPQLVATSLDASLIQPVIDAAAQYKAIPTTVDARTLIV